ncbi:unnamed protein product [Closterium sp. NIES-53]
MRAPAAREQPLPRAPLLPVSSPCPERPCCPRTATALRAPSAREQLLPQRAPSSGLCLQGSRPSALRVAPCCSPRIALCCSARCALLQPARRALLPCASRPAAAHASRPTAARASRSAAPHVMPCCSPRVTPCCPVRRALLQPVRRALLPCTVRALLPAPPSLSRPPATTAAARANAAAGGGAAGSAGGAAGTAGAGGAGGAAGSTGGAGGAGPTTDRHCVSWPLSRQLQRLRVDSSGHCLSRTTLPLSSFLCVTCCVEATALDSSESAAAPRASESAAALGARESADVLGASASTATGPASAEALHTFMLVSGTSHCFFCDYTTVTPLTALVPVSLAGPTRGPVVSRASTVLPCPAVPSGSLSGLHLPAFSPNLLSNAVLPDEWPGSGLYTLTTASAQVAESSQVAASSRVSAFGQLAASCSCRHELPRSPAPPCLSCVEGRQRAAPHSSEFPPTTTPLAAELGGAGSGGAGVGAAEPGGATSGAVEPGVSPAAASRREPLSPQELQEWFARRWRRAAGAGASSTVEGAGAAGPGAAGSAGTPGAGAPEGVGAETTAVCPGGGSTTGAAGGPAAGGVGGAGVVAEGAGAVPAESGVAARPRPYFVPLLQQVLGLSSPVECPQPVQSQSLLEPSSPLPAPSPYTGPTGGLAERREPASRSGGHPGHIPLPRPSPLLPRLSLTLTCPTPVRWPLLSGSWTTSSPCFMPAPARR